MADLDTVSLSVKPTRVSVDTPVRALPDDPFGQDYDLNRGGVQVQEISQEEFLNQMKVFAARSVA
jgi:hypothetical protein